MSGYKYGIDPENEFYFRCPNCDTLCYSEYEPNGPRLFIIHGDGLNQWKIEASDSSKIHDNAWMECMRRERFVADSVSV